MQRNTLFVYVRVYVFVCKWVCENARVFVYVCDCVCVCVSVCFNCEQSTLVKIKIKKITFSIIDDLIQLIVKIVLYDIHHILNVNNLKSVYQKIVDSVFNYF